MTSEPMKPSLADPRRPHHVGVAVGLSTGLYAAALAGITLVQAAHDQALVADRRPMQLAIGMLGSTHDRVERRMEAARATYEAAAGGYDSIAKGLARLQADLERLDATVAAIEGTSVSGPRRPAAGPGVPAVVPVGPAPAAPAPAAPPPTSATTGASGAPP